MNTLLLKTLDCPTCHVIPFNTIPKSPKFGVTSSSYLPKSQPTSNITPLAQLDSKMRLPMQSYKRAMHSQHNIKKYWTWAINRNNTWTSPHNTRTSEPNYTNWWQKSTAQNFSIGKRVKTPHRQNPKKTPRRTITPRDMISINNPSSTTTHMESAVTSPMAAWNESSLVGGRHNEGRIRGTGRDPTSLKHRKGGGSDCGGCGFKYRNLKASGCTGVDLILEFKSLWCF